MTTRDDEALIRQAFKAGRDSRDIEVARLTREINRRNVINRADLTDLQDDADRQVETTEEDW